MASFEQAHTKMICQGDGSGLMFLGAGIGVAPGFEMSVVYDNELVSGGREGCFAWCVCSASARGRVLHALLIGGQQAGYDGSCAHGSPPASGGGY